MKTMKLVCALSILFVAACGDSQGTTSGSASTTTTATTPTSANAVEGLTNASCLSYLEKTKACIQKAPESEREQRNKAIAEIEKTWTEQSKTADGRKRLETSCGAALKQFEETGTCQ